MTIAANDLFYATAELDRQSEKRGDSDWLVQTLHAPLARFLLLHEDRNLFTHINERYLPAFLTFEVIADLWAQNPPWAYLGQDRDGAFFVLDVSDLDEAAICGGFGTQYAFEDLRRAGPISDRTQAARCAYARGLMFWHRRHRYCGACGTQTEMTQAGHVRQCSNKDCGLEHFPRTDPAVIMLVHDEERCLLAHNTKIRDGMYSTLAGFVEPGETLEQAVKREVMEETGVRVGGVHYAGSQPWPFPTSLMLGFYASAESYELCVDTNELTDAQWFTRNDLKNFEALGKRLPSRDSIARNLIDAWLKEG